LLKLITPATVKGDVRITVPGQVDPERIRVEYVYQRASEHDRWRDEVNRKLAAGTPVPELLHPVIKGWDGVLDQDGKPIELTFAALQELTDLFPAAAGELYRGFTAVLTESRAGN